MLLASFAQRERTLDGAEDVTLFCALVGVKLSA
jgi:hypothetical protein